MCPLFQKVVLDMQKTKIKYPNGTLKKTIIPKLGTFNERIYQVVDGATRFVVSYDNIMMEHMLDKYVEDLA
jgi:hypothetical protein